MKKGRLIVISGPSGVGKGTVVKGLLARDTNTWLSVSATTRAIRPSETDGVQYHFISHEQFDRMIAEGQFLEYARYVNNCYGSPLEPIEQKLAEGRDVLLEIEVQGALQIKQKRPEAITVFIAAPSFEALAARLRGRRTPTRPPLPCAWRPRRKSTGSHRSTTTSSSTTTLKRRWPTWPPSSAPTRSARKTI